MKTIDLKHCQIGSVSSRLDGSVKTSIITPELTISQRSELMEYHGKNARVMIDPIDTEADGVEEIDATRETKKPSQRLRSVLFIHYKQHIQNKKDISFDAYYELELDRIINHYKGKLDQ